MFDRPSAAAENGWIRLSASSAALVLNGLALTVGVPPYAATVRIVSKLAASTAEEPVRELF